MQVMPDICDLILDDHETFRRRFAELDELRGNGAEQRSLVRVWGPLADLLEVHAACEEDVFYPGLLEHGDRSGDETDDAINDHNEIRDAVRRAQRSEVGTQAWWQAVLDARSANSDHMAEEEREAIPDFRTSATHDLRDELGGRWVAFEADHANAGAVDTSNKDPDRYISRHS